MKFSSLAIAVLALAATTAQADTFNYSYTFANGGTVTGSFDGTATGNLVTNMSNMSVFFNGIQVPFGNLDTVSAYATGILPSSSTPLNGTPHASFDGTQNNFLITTPDHTSYFYILNPGWGWGTQAFLESTVGRGNDTQNQDYGYDWGAYDYPTDYQSGYTPANWTLTNVSAVPEPESFALMLAGLGLMGAVARRRGAKQA